MEAPQPKRSGFALFYARSRGEIASEKWGVREWRSKSGFVRESDAFSDKKSALERGNNCRPKLNLLSGSEFDSGGRGEEQEERREGAIILGLGGSMFNVGKKYREQQ